MRILIVEDDLDTRLMLQSLVESMGQVDIAVNGKEAIRAFQLAHAGDNPYDLILLDIMMPQMNGIEAVTLLRQENTETKLIILTAFEDSLHIERALEAGADGYLAKDISAKDLNSALFKAVAGERVFSNSILRILQNKYVPYSEKDETMITISPREQEIMNLLAQGKTSQQISDELFISIRTVQAHRSNIMQKLGIKNAAGLVRYAVIHYTKNQLDRKI